MDRHSQCGPAHQRGDIDLGHFRDCQGGIRMSWDFVLIGMHALGIVGILAIVLWAAR